MIRTEDGKQVCGKLIAQEMVATYWIPREPGVYQLEKKINEDGIEVPHWKECEEVFWLSIIIGLVVGASIAAVFIVLV